MQRILQLIIGLSTLVMGLIGIYAFKNRRVPGAYPLFIQMAAAVIWALGSVLEIGSSPLETKIFWRNVQQIGVFVIPICNVFFAIDYTKQIQLKKFAYILSIIPVTALLLIYTNEHHHIMRLGYTLTNSYLNTKSLEIITTIYGRLFVAFNYFFQGISILILLDFARKISERFKKQIYVVAMSMLLTLLLAWFRTSYLLPKGVYVPISVLYMPSAIILFYSIFKYKFFNISPIARDKVFDIINEGIIVVDQEGSIVDLNKYAINLLNKFISLDTDIIGQKIDCIFNHINHKPQVIFSKQEEIKEIHFSSGKDHLYMSIGIYPLSVNNKENQIGAVIIINNITEKKIYELGLKEMANKDSLTGLLNKRGFSDGFDILFEGRGLKSEYFSVFMMDIDLFKNINDTYGHGNGDKVLQHFAEILKSTLRCEDIIGRVGGEEFAVILPNINKNNAFAIAERIRKKVEESSLLIMEDKLIKYTVSIGIADNTDSEIDQEKLLHKADMALYEAKQISRNCTVIYNK